MPDPTHIKDLLEDPQNRRSHNARNIGLITDGLQSVGAARSIVINERNEILAGNGVVAAAGDAGITKVQVVDVDGDTLVAVRRKGLTEEQQRQLAMFDNRSSELSEWNTEQLQADVAANLDLTPFFTDEELDKILGSEEDATKEIEPLEVDQPSDVVWVLLAIPIADWAKHLPVVEQLEHAAQFSASVVRTKAGKEVAPAVRRTASTVPV